MIKSKISRTIHCASSLSCLSDYLEEKEMRQFDDFTYEVLPDMLNPFYSDLRCKDGVISTSFNH